jgi:hypothetical protein
LATIHKQTADVDTKQAQQLEHVHLAQAAPFGSEYTEQVRVMHRGHQSGKSKRAAQREIKEEDMEEMEEMKRKPPSSRATPAPASTVPAVHTGNPFAEPSRTGIDG